MRTRPSSKLVCIHKTDAQAGILFLPLLLWKELNPQSFSRLWVVQTTLDIFTSLPIPLPALEYSVPSPHCPPPPHTLPNHFIQHILGFVQDSVVNGGGCILLAGLQGSF